tara:strand:- start:19370 stop:19543 length:174 start_codon:yes stop_codon:yes gene_type:complete
MSAQVRDCESHQHTATLEEFVHNVLPASREELVSLIDNGESGKVLMLIIGSIGTVLT